MNLPDATPVNTPLLRPGGWTSPAVGAAMSTRAGGVSLPPFDSLNLGRGTGDELAAVDENRRRFLAALDAPPPARAVWLRQVHGAHVLALDAASDEHPEEPADAAWTRTPGVACLVGAADCMPVLFAARDGRAVAAAHAGWRGLAAGVLEATVAALVQGAGLVPQDIEAWLGPCIGPANFEVGADVLQAFAGSPGAEGAFTSAPRPDGSPRWRADLPRMALARLRQAGLTQLRLDGACTVAERERFFSYRRDARTGRMVAAIWLR